MVQSRETDLDSGQQTKDKIKPTQLVAAVLATCGLFACLFFWASVLFGGDWPSLNTGLVMSVTDPLGIYLFYFYAFKGRLPWKPSTAIR